MTHAKDSSLGHRYLNIIADMDLSTQLLQPSGRSSLLSMQKNESGDANIQSSCIAYWTMVSSWHWAQRIVPYETFKYYIYPQSSFWCMICVPELLKKSWSSIHFSVAQTPSSLQTLSEFWRTFYNIFLCAQQQFLRAAPEILLGYIGPLFWTYHPSIESIFSRPRRKKKNGYWYHEINC